MVAKIEVECMDYRYNPLNIMNSGGIYIVRNAGGDVLSAQKTIEGLVDYLVSNGEKEIEITVLVHRDCGAMKCLYAVKTKGKEDVNKLLTDEFKGFTAKSLKEDEALQEYEEQNRKVQDASIKAIVKKKEVEHPGVHIVAEARLITLPEGHKGEHKLVAIPVSSDSYNTLAMKFEINLSNTYIISVNHDEETKTAIATAKELGIENIVNHLKITDSDKGVKGRGSLKVK